MVLPAGTPKEQYDHLQKLMLRSDYEGAEAGWREFLRVNARDALAPNAWYWLGETFYARNDYPQAARAFLDGYEKHPKAEKAPDSLLKLGMSLAALKQVPQACGTFDKLTKEFPNAAAPIKQAVTREKGKLACR
ncbi:MAG: tol-pal system protein YbgF [Alphaproteobacteria bacterium]|nr:tol-pal system protein YbgF [Alphaproteobacteria bacterium]